jgi:phage shock protein A
MGVFKRLFKIGKAEAHAVVDNLENPIKMTEQGIRDLKADLEKSIHALAEVKALAIRSKNEANGHKAKAQEWEQKAILLLQKAEQGAIAPEEADRLASTSLQKKEEAMLSYNAASINQKKFDDNVAKLEANIKTLKANVTKWENEAKMLKARAKVSEATQNVNKQLANVDSSGTVSMLERMKEKVEQQEALSESYGEIALENKGVDEEIDSVLENTNTSGSDALAALKAKLSAKEIGDGTNNL